jgi:DNA end-binding protein Ku
MAQRPIWRGHLRLALVSCPVALYSAKHDRSTIRFNMINPETGNRIKMLTVDAETEKELQRRDLVKGYEFKKNHYLLLGDADFESVKVESSSTMTIEKFVEKNSIDPIYFNASYYLAPDGLLAGMSMPCCTKRSRRPDGLPCHALSSGSGRERSP